MGYFYKAIVQAVLLYGAETWVVADRMLKLLDSFHHKCARHIAQDPIHQKPDGTWHTPCSQDVLQQCGLFSMSEYIRRRKETIQPFVHQRPIYASCLQSTPTACNINQKVWW